ncbi:hypothetical protein OIO90_006421 [Microbotryomycetes sp. JL221]|nr:hypothetical protein OIO90_006421 [Microbotryomycetes sp. JL221]
MATSGQASFESSLPVKGDDATKAAIFANSETTSDRASTDEDHDFGNIAYTDEEERQLVRKLDWALLPGLTFLYLLSFLDRANVGNAKLYGMLEDLNITDGSVYNTSLALYFVGYCLFEVPANAILKKTNPKIWLPILTIAFGVVATLQAIVTNEAGFLAARFFLGVAEAVGKIPHFGSLPNWAAIFAIEGMFTVLVGVSAFWWVPGYPHDATFLKPREKQILLARLAKDSDSADREPFTWSGVVEAFKDVHVIGYAFLFHGFAFGLYSLSLFVPTVIAQLGYKAAHAQLLTIPLYAAAFICIGIVAWLSNKTQKRALWIVVSGVVAIIGYIVLLTTDTAESRYGGLVIAAVGIYAATSVLLAWPSMNCSPQTKRATASAIQIFIGDFGAVAGVLIYRPSFNANFFRKAHIIAIGYTVFGTLVAAWLWWSMARLNRKRALKLVEVEKGFDRDADKKLGDRATTYVYQL